MLKGIVQFPGVGCIVEFMQGNAPQIAWILEERQDKLRLILPNRREMPLQKNRLLPWSGPAYADVNSRDIAVERLIQHREKREKLAASLRMDALWSMAQGEMTKATASWFAELELSDPDVDAVAAYGRALLACKTHFKFQSPDFEVFSESVVAARQSEQEASRNREELARQGSAWLSILWEMHCKKRQARPQETLSPDVADQLQRLLLRRIADPEAGEDETAWRLLTKGLPDDPLLPLYLAEVWGLVPPHYNFWLDRADYTPGDAWAEAHTEETANLLHAATHTQAPCLDTAFISVDNATTRDIDDALHIILRPEGGWILELALACPALVWPFGGALDKAVIHRATSLYLPEGSHHMLPERLGVDAYALAAGILRPALVVRCTVASDGTLVECEPFLNRVRVQANLTYEAVEAALYGFDSPASAYAVSLRQAQALAAARQACRIRNGAVIIERPDPQFVIVPGENTTDVNVLLEHTPEAPEAHRIVSELMILANVALADWAVTRGVNLLYRTQDIVVPKEYVGIWSAPHEVARVVRALAPTCLETVPRPHAGLGAEAYATTTSPLRRYPDLINEAQILHTLEHGAPKWSKAELDEMLPLLNARLDAAVQVQRQRPRYWKLLYARQQGDKHWWPAVITDENDAFVSVSLPREQLFLRARRALFGDRVQPGQEVAVRLHKVHPVQNEVQIAEVRELN